jgi:hypothetical protein
MDTTTVSFERKCTSTKGRRLIERAKALGLPIVSYDAGYVDRAATAWRFAERIEVTVPTGSDPGDLEQAAEAWTAAGCPLAKPDLPPPTPYCRCGAGAACQVHPAA